MEQSARRVVMVSPAHYAVSYAINPWMRPEQWSADPDGALALARRQWRALADRLAGIGLTVEVAPGQPGLPDMVFPANAAIVLDGRALLARFRYPERQGEEAHFAAYFTGLVHRGLLNRVVELPVGVFQEGAGDCLWDEGRRLFWGGFGQRSTVGSLEAIGACFGQEVVGLQLVTPHYYHLDTCFAVLSGGEVMYYPGAFSTDSLARIAERVPAGLRIEATAEEAAAFSLNTVNLERDLVMAPPPPRLAAILAERGYRCHPVDLSSFILSGGAAYCMTLRLDRRSGESPAAGPGH